MDFKTRTLGDICDEGEGIIKTGPFGTQLHQSDYKNEGVPVIMPKNIKHGKVSVDDIARIGNQDVSRLSNHRLKKGDIIYGRRGDIGRRALIGDRENGWLCGTGCLRLNLGNLILDPVFLYYYLGQSQVISWIYNQAIGATMPNLNTDIIRSIPISYPPFPTQRKIAAILSAYDDLIENNTRGIKILEEMAQVLYHEWFVKFRFPGHEKVKMVESELGMVPEGWDMKVFGELLKHHIGGGWGKEKDDNKFSLESFVIRGTDIPQTRYASIENCPLRFHKESNLKSRLLKDKDIVFEVSGGSKGQPVGRALFISQKLLDAFEKDVICASFCKLLRINNEIIIPEIIYLHLLEIYENGNIEKYQTQSTGIINFKFSFFNENELIVIPVKDLQVKFAKIISPIFNLIHSFGIKNNNLRRTRDLLLPKLISGEIDVSNIEIEMGEKYT
jgi:type I restriction enzyme S subunit